MMNFKSATAAPIDATTAVLYVIGSTNGTYPDTHPGLVNAKPKRLYLAIKNDQAGTLKSYKSHDRGTTWLQISSSAVAAAAATAENNVDFLIEPYVCWRLDWLNGGVTQTQWAVDMSLGDERSVAS